MLSYFNKLSERMSFQGGFGGGFQSMANGAGGSGGGGFMSPGSSDSQGMEKKKNRSQTLLPVTGAMLHKSESNQTEDVFSFQGVDIHQVTFVGIIRDVLETATNITYKIDDMTGEFILVKKWIDVDDPLEQGWRSQCRECTYVRVVGNMKSFNSGQVRSVMAFSMIPVTDFNEISYHILDVIHANLSLKKGSASKPAIMQSQQRYTNDTNDNNYMGSSNDAGLTGTNKVVFNYISACTSEQGISINELCQKNRNMNEQQLRNCIEWLSNEGHIYSTVDDDHYRSTSS